MENDMRNIDGRREEILKRGDGLPKGDQIDLLGQITSTIAHDLNNLLATILGKVQLLLRKVKDQELRERLHSIEEIVNDGKEKVMMIHAFSRALKEKRNLIFENDDPLQGYLDFALSRNDDYVRSSRGIEREKEDNRTSHENLRQKAMILIIDDDQSVLGLLKDMLEWCGHRIVLASCGEDGIELFKRNQFDMVITDHMMPHMNGLKVAEEIKKIDPQIPIVLITGYDCNIGKEVSEKKAVDFFITKPFNLREISEMIYDVLWRKAT